ncbi:AbiV family abortive infection protein [Mesorhizobium sp.]|uniref:AbiV family abortive infection protein n=1 Tax=Mesorhizobium sp. TaxID=1871066 RepID=UPI000FE678CF|nr:AbiV family abortive infection protein [Mesorhizobium sp.]RWP38871.1 MAG: AbiV family abortive infection protein [Mesorhizobium sp.]
MGSPHTPKMTTDLLRAYSGAALRNADELLVEASLLRDHDHMARAYFLAVACIEEAGKALQAFDAQNRNLSDPAVCTKLKAGMESHSQKVSYALGIWALSSPDQSGAMKVALDVIFHLKRGREPAMYSDLRTNPDRVQIPREIVRAVAARDCVRLAESCLAHAHRHVSEKTPAKFTSAQDRLFTMKSARFQEMLNTEDFWWYFISRMEVGQQDIAEAVLMYERDHIKTGIPFRPVEASDETV